MTFYLFKHFWTFNCLKINPYLKAENSWPLEVWHKNMVFWDGGCFGFDNWPLQAVRKRSRFVKQTEKTWGAYSLRLHPQMFHCFCSLVVCLVQKSFEKLLHYFITFYIISDLLCFWNISAFLIQRDMFKYDIKHVVSEFMELRLCMDQTAYGEDSIKIRYFWEINLKDTQI